MRSIAIAFAPMALLSACGASQSRFHAAPDARRIPGRYVIVLDPVTKPASTSAVARISGGRVVRTFTALFSGMEIEVPPERIPKILEVPGVTAVHEVRKVEVLATTTTRQPASDTWSLDRLDQIEFPLDGQYQYATSGKEVEVYVLDTGVRATHRGFEKRVEVGIDTTVEPPVVGRHGDCHGHGTHVAGIVNSRGYGVAKNARVISVRVLDCNGEGNDASLAAAFEWILTRARRHAVVNMSLGEEGTMPLVEQGMEKIVAAGHTVVAAAGNSGADACGVSPANIPLAITVASSSVFRQGERRQDGLSLFSNHGTCVDLLAPGDNVRSLSHGDDDSTRMLSGTSMAAPHVAAAAALVLERNPGATPREVLEFLLGNAIHDKIKFWTAAPGTPNVLLNLAWNR